MENNENILSEMARAKELMSFKYAINEQRRLKIQVQKGKRIRLKDGKPSKTEYVDFENYSPVTPESEWDTYLTNDEKMVSLMDAKSLKNWSTLKSDAINKGYAVAALEQFNSTYKRYKWKKVVVGQKDIIDTVTVEGEVKEYPTVPIKFPGDLSPSSNFFKDNYYEVTDLFIQTVKTDIIDPIVTQLNALPDPGEGIPKAVLNSMDVLSSCSRLPNGPSPDGTTYSFVELSQKRNETATNYVIAELRKIGVLVPDTFKPVQNWMGQNNDGTSGPKWNSKWSKEIKDTKRPEYEKYKYLDMDLEVIFNSKETPGPDETPDEVITIRSDVYDISFYTPGKKGISIRLPKIIMRIVGTKKRRSRKKPRTTRCYFFDK